MDKQPQLSGVGAIFATLAQVSSRPCYAFLVLQLVSEAANAQGRAGPLVEHGKRSMLLRDWLCTQLLPMSERDGRRAALRARIVKSLASRLTGDTDHDHGVIESAVEEQVLAVGQVNVSRAISDLIKAGLLTRHYAGYAADHCNRGAGRHAVYVLCPRTMLMFGRDRPEIMPLASLGATYQADLSAKQFA